MEYRNIFVLQKPYQAAWMDPGRSVEWGLGNQFCQPILLQTKFIGFNNGIILHVDKILFILYENSDWKIWSLLQNQTLKSVFNMLD